MSFFKRGSFILCIFLVVFSSSVFAYDYRIYNIPDLNEKIPITFQEEHYVTHGKINLPNGSVAPSGGIKVKIIVKNSSSFTFDDLIIPEGATYVDYKLETDSESIPELPYYVLEENYGYVLQGGYGCSDYKNIQEYNTVISQYKDKFNRECNLTLIPCSGIISGTIYLPDGLKAFYGGEHITVCAKTDTESYSRDITIPESKNSADYFLCVQSKKDYTISYKYIGAPMYPYVTEGFYHNNLTRTISLTSGAITGINLGIINKTDIDSTPLKRSLTRDEYWELTEKTSGSAISLKSNMNGEKIEFSISSEMIDKWEKWGQGMASITPGAIVKNTIETKDGPKVVESKLEAMPINIFKLKGYCLYSCEKSFKDSSLISYSSNTKAVFNIKPLTTGIHYYYCQAIFEYGLRSSKSNIIKIIYNKDVTKIKIIE